MKDRVLLKKLRMDSKDFVTAAELREYSKGLKINYNSAIGHFITRGHMIRIFKGIFYVKTLDEMMFGRIKYSHLELIAKGLELKGVKNWYFGVYSGLKLNNMTHEYFSVDYVVNDKLLRVNPMKISGHRVRFLKLKSSLFSFGVINKGAVLYSDPEKTILDFIYIWRYSGLQKERIIADVGDWIGNLSWSKFLGYSKNYPRTVQVIAREIVCKHKVVA